MKPVMIILTMLFSTCSLHAVQTPNVDNMQQFLDVLTDISNTPDDFIVNIRCDLEFTTPFSISNNDFDIQFVGNIPTGRIFSTPIPPNSSHLADFVNCSSITFANISFVNFHSPSNGGAIHFTSNIDGSFLTTNNCTFTDCHSDLDGGAVYINGATFSYEDCSFSSCSAGTVISSGSGGAFSIVNGMIRGSVTQGSNFQGNASTAYGGALCISNSYIDILGNQLMTFTENNAADGGAVTIIGHHVEGLDPEYFSISGCSFSDNHSSNNGGAIFTIGLFPIEFPSTLPKLGISSCLFTFNAATRGGSISTDFCSISSCTFSGINSTVSMGGYIYTDGGSDITNCSFIDGVAANGGAVVCNNYLAGVTFRDCKFTGCFASNLGGGVLFNAKTVSFENCSFNTSAAGKRGGAIASWLVPKASGEFGLSAIKSSFKNCTVLGPGPDLSGGAISTYSTVDIETTTFEDCFVQAWNTDNNSGKARGGAIFSGMYYQGDDYNYNHIRIKNSLFNSCSIVPPQTDEDIISGDALYLDDSDVPNPVCDFRLIKSTISNCGHSLLINGGVVEVENSAFENIWSGNAISQNINGINIAASENNFHATYNLIDFGATIPGPFNFIFSDPNHHNHNINSEINEFGFSKWYSPCYDKLPLSYSFFGSVVTEDVLDFDVTLPDVGWQPTYEPQTLSIAFVQDGILQCGHYTVPSSMSLTVGSIADGTVISVATDASLELLPQSGQLNIGSLTGPRTAIVGRPAIQDPPAQMISFGRSGSSNAEDVSLKGVLLNYVPLNGFKFSNANVNLKSTEMSLKYCELGALDFSHSKGSVEGFDFQPVDGSDEFGLGRISQYASNIDIIGNHFGIVNGTSGAAFALKIYGNMAKQTLYINNNTFNGENTTAFPVVLDKAVAHFRGNTFNNLKHGGIRQFNSTSLLYKGAKNHFKGFDGGLGVVSAPLIFAEAGEIDLFCGFNDMIRPASWDGIPLDFVEYSDVSRLTYDNWTRNYWGRSESEQYYSATDVRDLTPLIDVADVGELLLSYDQAYVSCDRPLNGSIGRLELGITAEAVSEWAVAEDAYATLLVDFPNSKEANEAAIRLKALGLMPEYGSENYEEVHLDLQLAKNSTQSVNPRLSTFLHCADLLIEGRHLDHSSASTALTNLHAQTTDTTDLKCIELAQLELATFPIPGQTSRGHEAAADRAIRWHRAVDDLMYHTSAFHVTESAPVLAELPSQFAIVTCYPNPFNPTATLVLDVPDPGTYRVALHNLLGQLVQVVKQGELAAGRHTFQIHGESLASGMYVIRAEGPVGHCRQKVMLLK